MTTNLGSKIIERESGIKPKTDKVEKVLKYTDAVIGWEPVPEPIKDPELSNV
jgi:hypothetical protein